MAVKYVEYPPSVLQGQAVLDFKRTRKMLIYRGDTEVEPRISRGMPLYETKLTETIGENKEGNLVMRGECLSACAYLKENGITVDLVYIDPPFASGADYAKKIYLRRNPKLAEKLEKAKGELSNEDLKTFEAKMYGDIWEKEKYLDWMYENLLAIKSVMSPTASIYVHLDYHIGHYVKILLDEVFGEDRFKAEIVWKRSSAHNDSTTFANIHDSIFFYQNPGACFNTTYIPYSKEYIENYYSKKDKRGNYKDSDLTAIGKSGGGYTYEWNGITKEWICPLSKMEQLHNEGRLYYTSKGTPRLKQYLDEMPGLPTQDIWTDIFAVNSQAQERVDYATQKPEALLKRIIEASSNKGMVVADFFGGSGVTAAVAAKTGRRFIHVDVNSNSINTTRDRLVKEGAEFEIIEIKDGVSLFRNPVQTNEILPKLINGLVSDNSLSKYWTGAKSDSKSGKVPVHLPNLLIGPSERVFSLASAHKLVYEELSQLPTEVRKVIIYYIDIDDIDEIQQYIKDHSDRIIEVEFLDIKIVLDNLVAQDEAELQLTEITDKIGYEWKVEVLSFFSDRVKRKIDDFNQKSAFNSKSKSPLVSLSDTGLEAIEWISVDCQTDDLTAPWHSDNEIRVENDCKISLNGQKTSEYWDGCIYSSEKPKRVRIRNICGDESTFAI